MPVEPVRRAVFLDRDGTINADTGYVARPDEVRLLPRAPEGLKALAAAGYALVIVSNQSGIARGMMTPEQADAVEARVLELLRQHGAVVEAAYRCPHLPEGRIAAYAIDCECRKPKPGLILLAARERGYDLARSWTIGDSARDVEAGLAAGTRAILIAPPAPPGADAGLTRAADLLEAAAVVARGTP